MKKSLCDIDCSAFTISLLLREFALQFVMKVVKAPISNELSMKNLAESSP